MIIELFSSDQLSCGEDVVLDGIVTWAERNKTEVDFQILPNPQNVIRRIMRKSEKWKEDLQFSKTEAAPYAGSIL